MEKAGDPVTMQYHHAMQKLHMGSAWGGVRVMPLPLALASICVASCKPDLLVCTQFQHQIAAADADTASARRSGAQGPRA